MRLCTSLLSCRAEAKIKMATREDVNGNGHDIDMNPRKGGELPPDLLHRLMARLSMPCLFRCKRLSKQSRDIISSKRFKRSYTAKPEQWLSVFHSGAPFAFLAYDPNLDKWHNLPLSFLPYRVKVLASAGGMLCCRADLSGALRIVVCNPLSRKWLLLPPLINRRAWPIVTMLATSITEFKVVVAGHDAVGVPNSTFKDLTAEVYDSASNNWSLAGNLPSDTDLDMISAVLNGKVYLINRNPPGFVCYNPGDCSWTKLVAPVPRNLTIPTLVACCGRLFLVGGVASENDPELLCSIRAWELSHGDDAWHEFVRMQEGLFHEVCDIGGGGEPYFTAVSNGGAIYLLISKSRRTLALDVSSRSWHWLPDHPAAASSSDIGYLKGYQYVPRLLTAID